MAGPVCREKEERKEPHFSLAMKRDSPRREAMPAHKHRKDVTSGVLSKNTHGSRVVKRGVSTRLRFEEKKASRAVQRLEIQALWRKKLSPKQIQEVLAS